jgi:hypothetical protein
VDVTNTPHYFIDRGGATEAVASGGASIAPAQGLYVAGADYAISGRTAKFRLRVIVEANATAAGINFTFGLYPVSSVAGTADQITYTLGSCGLHREHQHPGCQCGDGRRP